MSKRLGSGVLAILVAAAVFSQNPPPRPSASSSALTGTWLNAKPGEVDEARKGRVTIVHFFTFGCSNCKANNPFYNQWRKDFGPDVLILGVHTPETEYEHDENNVKDALVKLGITYPVLLDGDHTNWNNWKLRYWPTVFVFDKKGRLRQTWEGELQYNGQHGYEAITAIVKKLVKE